MSWLRRARASEPGEPVREGGSAGQSRLMARYRACHEDGWFLPHSRGGVKRGGGEALDEECKGRGKVKREDLGLYRPIVDCQDLAQLAINRQSSIGGSAISERRPMRTDEAITPSHAPQDLLKIHVN
eukprot:scaffold25540_cov35-Tisochrysis_lutea.AAC.3